MCALLQRSDMSIEGRSVQIPAQIPGNLPTQSWLIEPRTDDWRDRVLGAQCIEFINSITQ